ncbi:MAG: hypothetical protein HY513_02635 [Candidatus Aenigmarchaeota archaeon]|nr:hypothetical protein [Candidatus Aenigmarchaeota archaeon]
MWHKIAAVIFVIFVFFIVTGNYLGEQCIEVNGGKGGDACKSCWKPIATSVKSDLCPDSEKACLASSEAQKYNAFVEATLCACDKAKADEFSDQNLNKKITELVFSFSGLTIAESEVSGFCNQPTVAVKQRYG